MRTPSNQKETDSVDMISFCDSMFESLAANPKLVVLQLAKAIEKKALSAFLTTSARRDINGIVFDFDFTLSYWVKDMYFGNYELATMEYLKKSLKAGDVFFDVGANIGYVSAIAASCVGPTRGEVHSFEPVPEYFHLLKHMASQNRRYKILVNQCALGDHSGFSEINISKRAKNQNIGWNTMVPGFMMEDEPMKTIKVPLYTLDQYVKTKGIHRISTIKIDVEGFEFPVLKGMQHFLKNTDNKPEIICEIAPAAYPLLSHSLLQLSDYMAGLSYEAFSLLKPNKVVDITELKQTTNVGFRSA